MFLMSIWSEGLILKAGAAEQRCERLCRGVQNLRFQLEHMRLCWVWVSVVGLIENGWLAPSLRL